MQAGRYAGWLVAVAAIAWGALKEPDPQAAVEWTQKTFVQLAQRAAPAVVNIDVVQEVRAFPFFGEESPVIQQKGVGSGFVLESDGLIGTNTHVVRGKADLTVTFSDGRRLRGKVLASDTLTDVALVRVQARGLPVLPLADSDKVQPGDWVMAIGSPLGLRKTVTAGIVSATGREFSEAERMNYLQTDAAINPGNSGGPLINLAGMVVGMNTYIAAGAQGIGFAIPSNSIRDIASQLKTHGQVQRPWLGVKVARLTPDLASQLGGTPGRGVVIFEVVPTSPAHRADLAEGDIILSIDGKALTDPADLVRALARKRPGQTLRLVVRREGRQVTINVKIGQRPPTLE